MVVADSKQAAWKATRCKVRVDAPPCQVGRQELTGDNIAGGATLDALLPVERPVLKMTLWLMSSLTC